MDNAIKILLVDDKKENLLSLQVILADRGYQFVEATSGKDALRILLKNQDFAIILMDVQMPLMDGFETAELIRQSDKLKNVPIIFLTANMNTNEYIFKGYQSGAVDYMIKPLSPEILQAKVTIFTELFRKSQELKKREEEARAMNEIILKTNAELALQNTAIAKHAEELRKKNMELDAFTYISSHDLQEPLRKIQTFTNIILSNEYPNLSENGKIKFDRILYATNRMRELINSLLTFSRATLVDRKFESVDLSTIIKDVKEALHENLLEKKAVIVTDFHDKATIIPFQFIQLMENLIHNAIKFSQKELPLQITIKSRLVHGFDLQIEKLAADVNYCHITFGDNGIGFEPQHNEKIFGVFQRLHGKDLYEGTGIGLAIVKKIVDNHNGYIDAVGEPMKGVTFNIYIPY
ncbi:response regulator [Flavobacterium sp. MC2016-06]|jgi:light-regulated signal transduction histidine kinase (bacteriophytochrome)|uniref:hybrid sensor histidine kinase/response regulator n=1 Tax=Flavobacterium sp. MC2016-06 TaxID=2676308 RepID=UPI0012BADB06|nr:hybrid sensor histidine kinase/response regulator [Flavobacterium sp. MC2016-06]MBU3857549.1 response regulator [Flavobacterium sp. MC2016-06]